MVGGSEQCGEKLIEFPCLKNLFDATPSCGGDPSRTYVGMAHFAGGTVGKTCGQCSFFTEKLKACQKAIADGFKGKARIPSNADACKYFESNK